MAGEDVFELRTFSGFDLARIVRNFEITASSTEETGQIRLVAVALYLVPAVAINGAVLHQLQAHAPGVRAASVIALFAAATYGLLVLGAVLLLSAASINDFERYVGWPRVGFVLTLAGLAALASVAAVEFRRRGSGG
jgi:hypothetical protein